jgi:NADPH:quinone reductase-like Zn-dependent oxidoreductase
MWLGCKVIGIAGSDEKVDFITKELGFDHGINYKTQNLKEAVDKACPNGIDVYFDNVGGETLDIALRKMNNFGRVSLCGAISQYTKTEVPQGPRNESSILQCKQAKVTYSTGNCIATLIRLQLQSDQCHNTISSRICPNSLPNSYIAKASQGARVHHIRFCCTFWHCLS